MGKSQFEIWLRINTEVSDITIDKYIGVITSIVGRTSSHPAITAL